MILKSDIAENKIFVLNNILSEQELTEYWFQANSCGYTYTQGSTRLSNKNHRRLAYHFPLGEPCPDKPDVPWNPGFVNTTPWGKIEKLFQDPIGLLSAYINYSELSSRSLAHSDGIINEPSVLICLNEHWDRDWGGYTVFFKGMNSDEIVKAVCPVPGQIIIFNGFNWHLALPPTIYAQVPRFMLALKLKYI